jgi:hypothetical protein
VILDDIHVRDEPSLLVLGHLAEQITDAKLLVFAAFRDVEAARVLAGVLPDLLRSSSVERLDLRPFRLAEVHEQLSWMAVEEGDARAVLDVTSGQSVVRPRGPRRWPTACGIRTGRRAPYSTSSVPGSIVATAADGDPAAAGDLVRQLVQRRVAVPVRIDSEVQLGHWVEAMGVAAELGEEDLRLEGPHERGHDGMERAQPAGVADPRR